MMILLSGLGPAVIQIEPDQFDLQFVGVAHTHI
jgi:hypothetical protein